MKRILYILFLCFAATFVKAQYPAGRLYQVNQSIGSDSALVTSKGGLKGRIINWSFTDTTQANTQPIKNYPGAQIFTTLDTSFWLRNTTATKWLRGSGSVDITTFNFLNDSTLIICFGNGVCDTIQLINFDSTVVNIVQNFLDTSTTIINNGAGCNGLLPGGGLVSPTGVGFNVFVQAASYNINCRHYTSNDTTITLTGATTNCKFTIVGVDTSGRVFVLNGTEAADPQLPQVDPASQLELTHFLICPGDTTLTQIFTEVIYNENLGTPPEWNTAQNNWTTTTPADFNNLANPFNGLKAIFISNSGTTNSTSFMTFTASDTVRLSTGYQILKFFLRLNATFNSNQGFSLQWANSAGSPNSNVVNVLPGIFTFDGSAVNVYQTVVISMSSFVFTDTGFSRLIIRPINVAKNFYMDWIQLQGGLTNTAQTGNFIWNQFQGPRLENFWMSGIGQADRFFTSRKTGGSENFGWNSNATGGGTGIGYGAQGLNGGVAVGQSASANNSIGVGNSVISTAGSIHIGNTSPTATGVTNVGMSISSTAGDQVNFGAGLISTASNTMQFGRLSRTTGADDITIGYLDSNLFTLSHIFGNSLKTTATRQMLFGDGNWSAQRGVRNVYFGSGVTNQQADDVNIGITGEVGTNQNGHSLSIDAGAGTGNASSGSNIYFKTSDAGASGTAIQTLTAKASIEGGNKGFFLTDARFQPDKGTNTAAANDLTLPTDGSLFTITGNTQINAITTANWQAGAIVSFVFTGTPLLKNNTAGGGGTATMLLAGRVDFQAAVGDYLQLQYDGTNWYETNRSLAGTTGGGYFFPNQTNTTGTTTHNALYKNFLVNNIAISEYTAGTNGNYSVIHQDSTLMSFYTLHNASAASSDLWVRPDSIRLLPFLGTLNIDSLRTGNSDDNIVTWNEGMVRRVAKSALYPTLQQVFNTEIGTGSIITKNDTVTDNGGNFGLVFRRNGTGYGLTVQNLASPTGPGLYVSGSTPSSSTASSFDNNGGGAAIGATVFTTSTSIINVVQRNAVVTSGTAANGFGISQTFSVEAADGFSYITNNLESEWRDATGRTSMFTIVGTNAGATNDVTAFDGSGVVGIGRFSSFGATRLDVVDNAATTQIVSNFSSTSITSGSILSVSLVGTGAASSTQTGILVSLSGANSTAGQTTYGIRGLNSHTGSGTTINIGVYGEVTNGTSSSAGVYGNALADQIGVRGNSSSNYGGFFVSSSGIAVSSTTTTGSLSGIFIANPSSTNTTQGVLRLLRTTSGTAANGIAGSLEFYNEDDAGGANGQLSNEIISKWTNAANVSRSSQLIFTGVDSATTDDILRMGDRVTLTESSATTFTSTTIPDGRMGGGEIIVTVTANDAIDFQARTLRFSWSAVRKGATTTVNFSTPDEVVAVSAGTLTVTITAVDGGSGVVNFQANAVSSLTQTILRCSYQISKNF